MKYRKSKIIIFTLSIIMFLMFLNNLCISCCGNHILLCEEEDCKICLFIQTAEETFKSAFIITCFAIVFANIRLIDNVTVLLKNKIDNNLIIMNVILIE